MRKSIFTVLLALSAGAAFGQVTGISPEIHPDRTVTFRLRAPNASRVLIFGDWLQPNPAMAKDAAGIWTLTTAPLEATVHVYNFVADGMVMTDPENPIVKLRQQAAQSLVEVPASPAAPWTLTDVPHGSVVTELRRSPILQRDEKIVVYLPPGYHRSAARYPVLYLIHGAGDVTSAWIASGSANLILDNLIAEKRARPMIVVMPAGHAALPGPSPRIDNSERFDRYLTKEVIPFIESEYRVAPGARNRALAGFSMGGGLTFTSGFDHQDLFSALGMFSASVNDLLIPSYKSLLDDAKGVNARLPVIWSGCGDKDPQCANMKKFADAMQEHGIHATLRVVEGGGHTWPVWRVCLSEFAPLLFPEKK